MESIRHYCKRLITLCSPTTGNWFNLNTIITVLRCAESKLDLKIILNNIKDDEIIGKLYCEKEELAKSENFLIDENPKRIYIGFIPDFISVYLLKNDGETLDFRRVYLNWPSSTSKDIVIDVKEGDVLSMIEQGENQHIEFKKELNNKEKQEFVETAVAFSNGKGGAILIGVDDKARIVGYNQEKIEEAKVRLKEVYRLGNIIGKSPVMQNVFDCR